MDLLMSQQKVYRGEAFSTLVVEALVLLVRDSVVVN